MEESAAALIRQARITARLSQTDLARRAGIAQPVVSAYEAGRREPSLPTLRKLINATGHRLRFDLVPPPSNELGLPDTPLGRRLRRHRAAVLALAANRGARNVRVFGSVARGQDIDGSDIDLLVDLDSDVGLLRLIGLERELAELLRTPVDVVPSGTLKPGVRDSVLADAITL